MSLAVVRTSNSSPRIESLTYMRWFETLLALKREDSHGTAPLRWDI